MQTQNMKARFLNKRSNKVDQLFNDVEEKYTYCNLKAYSRRMLQPMLNEKQEFVRLKWLQNNRQYHAAITPSFPWSNTTNEEYQHQSAINPSINEEINEKTEASTPFRNRKQNNYFMKKKLKKALNTRRNFSLNDVIMREQFEDNPLVQKVDDQVSDHEDNGKEKYEEYRGCSLNHTTKQVSQNITFYEKQFKSDLKLLPKFQQENDLIRRISSVDVLVKELKKAHNDNENSLQKSFVDEVKEKQRDDKQIQSMQTSVESTPQNRMLPDIYKQQQKSLQQDDRSQTYVKRRSSGSKIYKDNIYLSNSYQTQPNENKQKEQNQLTRSKQNSTDSDDQRKHKLSLFFSEKGDVSNLSESSTRKQIMRDYSTCITKQNQDSITIDYPLDTSLNQNTNQINIKNNQDEEKECEQQKTQQENIKKNLNFTKMHQAFQLNRVINPIKFGQRETTIQNIFSNQRKQIDLKIQTNCSSLNHSRSFSRNSSVLFLNGASTTNNSQMNSFSYDQVIQSGISTQKSFGNQYQRNRLLESKAMGISNLNPHYLQSQKKIYNVPKKERVPFFINKLKDTILEVEQLGDNPLTTEQTNQLTNSLGLLSIHNGIKNYTGQNVVDFAFDLTKDHYIVPQRQREGNQKGNQIPIYGSIAMLDKVYSVNLPDIYLQQGLGQEIEILNKK